MTKTRQARTKPKCKATAFLKRQLISINIDCELMGYTYDFDETELKVYEDSKLLSTWTVEQILNSQVYV
jgi:hypothetical protein